MAEPVRVPEQAPAPAVTDPMAAALVALSSGKLKKKKRKRSFWIEAPILILLAFIMALAIKALAFAPFYIPSGSMLPTLQIGDRILVNKLSYKIHDPGRGDIVVFQQGDQGHRNFFQRIWDNISEGLGRPPEGSKDLVKRVIGLPGETIEVKSDGVYINGTKLKEPWLQAGIAMGSTYGPRHLQKASQCPKENPCHDEYFVMGDNRANSSDSRVFGPIPKSAIVGRAILRIWPLSRAGGL